MSQQLPQDKYSLYHQSKDLSIGNFSTENPIVSDQFSEKSQPLSVDNHSEINNQSNSMYYIPLSTYITNASTHSYLSPSNNSANNNIVHNNTCSQKDQHQTLIANSGHYHSQQQQPIATQNQQNNRLLSPTIPQHQFNVNVNSNLSQYYPSPKQPQSEHSQQKQQQPMIHPQRTTNSQGSYTSLQQPLLGEHVPPPPQQMYYHIIPPLSYPSPLSRAYPKDTFTTTLASNEQNQQHLYLSQFQNRLNNIGTNTLDIGEKGPNDRKEGNKNLADSSVSSSIPYVSPTIQTQQNHQQQLQQQQILTPQLPLLSPVNQNFNNVSYPNIQNPKDNFYNYPIGINNSEFPNYENSFLTEPYVGSIEYTTSSSTVNLNNNPNSNSPIKFDCSKRRNTIPNSDDSILKLHNRQDRVCKVCHKRFNRPSGLKTHMHIHTGEKPFQCEWPDCGKKFSVRSNMIRHLKIHKKNDLNSIPIYDSIIKKSYYSNSDDENNQEIDGQKVQH